MVECPISLLQNPAGFFLQTLPSSVMALKDLSCIFLELAYYYLLAWKFRSLTLG